MATSFYTWYQIWPDLITPSSESKTLEKLQEMITEYSSHVFTVLQMVLIAMIELVSPTQYIDQYNIFIPIMKLSIYV